jgi:hypothetical protein
LDSFLVSCQNISNTSHKKIQKLFQVARTSKPSSSMSTSTDYRMTSSSREIKMPNQEDCGALLSERPATTSLDCTWDAIHEALGAMGRYRASSSCAALEPIPIHPFKVRVVDEIHLGSTWDLNDTIIIDELTWALAGYESLNTPAAKARKALNEPLPIVSSSTVNQANHEPRRAISSDFPAAPHIGALVQLKKWDERFQELLKFKEEYGHFLVPYRWTRNRELARWVKRQRHQFKLKCKGQKSALNHDRLRALEKVGFVWNSHHAIWDEKIQELKEFTRCHGHANVPFKYPQNRQLSIWVRSQRRQYKLLGEYAQGKRRSYMTKERYHQLRDLGFDFNPRGL